MRTIYGRLRQWRFIELFNLMRNLTVLVPFVGLIFTTWHQGQTEAVPPATLQRPVIDTYHGMEVTDPYRWLEDDASPEVHHWIDVQNALRAAAFLTRCQRPRPCGAGDRDHDG